MTTATLTPERQEAERALNALALELPATVHADVARIVRAALDAERAAPPPADTLPEPPHDAAERVEAFVAMRSKMLGMLGIDLETTSVHAGDADEPAALLTDDLRALVDYLSHPRPTVTMYLPYVYDNHGHAEPLAARTVMPTLEDAKAVLDVERRNAGKPALSWTDEFGGATAVAGGLRYDVVPVEVKVP